MIQFPIYLDNQSTTPLDPRVLAAMNPFLTKEFGNAASKHSLGRQANTAVEKARANIANLVHAQDSDEIIFTSGATESNNLAIKGLCEMYRDRGDHIITSAIEHKSVIDTYKYLESTGFQVTYLPVDSEGLINIQQLKQAITPKTILISIMHANNEIGVIQPISEIGKLAKERNVFFHSDVVQSLGKIPVDVQALHVDLASLSAHKIYGPKGIGALYVRKQNPRVRLASQVHGGGHERALRSGTLNVPGIVGFGAAAKIAQDEINTESIRILKLREKLRHGIEKIGEVYVNGSLEYRISGNLNVSFGGIEGETFLNELCKKLAVSSGSACTSATLEPSYVLKALGAREDRIHTSVRFGIGRFNTDEEINYTIQYVTDVVKKMRNLSPIYNLKKESSLRGSDPSNAEAISDRRLLRRPSASSQ